MSTQGRRTRSDKVTTQIVVNMKQSGEKISMLTAYDYTMAGIVDEAGIDVILVGDSASNVMAGFDTTVPMTLDHMIYHTSCVVRGVRCGLVVIINLMQPHFCVFFNTRCKKRMTCK
jgi:3-methyl-2-oxobutanoate hydroxymethyltransferase